MALTTLLLLVVLGTGRCTMSPTETTPELTTETMTTESSTTETTATTTTTPRVTTAPNITASKTTNGNRTQTSGFPHTTGNTTNFKSSNSSAGVTANSTAVPTSNSTAVTHANATTNSSSWFPSSSTNTTLHSSVIPTYPVGGGTVIPSTNGNTSSSAHVHPTQKTSVTSQGSTEQTPTAVQGSNNGPNPSKTAVVLPTAVKLLLRVPLSFRILNRSFNESLHDPVSREYRSLSQTVLTMFKEVFGCARCVGRQTYKGCSELSFSQGSVKVQSTLVFGQGDDTVTSNFAEQRLRNSLNQSGFIAGLQLADIQSSVEMISPAAEPAVPSWAIALLVLVCLLVLLSILTCILLTICACRRKSRGKLDLFATKDSYHPMAEYPPYQSHGRYVSPNKANAYSQVAGNNSAGSGTFTYTNPAATSDNL